MPNKITYFSPFTAAEEGSTDAGGATAAQISDIAAAQATADGKITLFRLPLGSIPTATAAGDYWYNTTDGFYYIAASVGADQITGGEWEIAQDSDIAQAITDASDAQATADGKVTTFYQTSPPTAEGVGDLWVDTDEVPVTIYRWDGADWDDVVGTVGATAAQVTDIGTATTNAATAQSTADGKITVFRLSLASIPTSEGAGDLWFNTTDEFWYIAAILGADAITGGEWEIAQDADIGVAISDAAGAQATADGKIDTYYQTSAPGGLNGTTDIGDLWVDTDAAPITIYRWDGTDWDDIVGTVGATDSQITLINDATSSLADDASDLKVDPGEKKNWVTRDAELEDIYDQLALRAANLYMDEEAAAALTAKTTYETYRDTTFAGYVGPDWDDVSGATTVDRATHNAAINAWRIALTLFATQIDEMGTFRPSNSSGVFFPGHFEKTAGASNTWDSSIRSIHYGGTDRFMPVGTILRWVITTVSANRFMVGFNSDPTNNDSWNSLDYALDCNGSNLVGYSSGSSDGTLKSGMVAGDIVEIELGASDIIARHNGVDVSPGGWTSGGGTELAIDTSFYTLNGELSSFVVINPAGNAIPVRFALVNITTHLDVVADGAIHTDVNGGSWQLENGVWTRRRPDFAIDGTGMNMVPNARFQTIGPNGVPVSWYNCEGISTAISEDNLKPIPGAIAGGRFGDGTGDVTTGIGCSPIRVEGGVTYRLATALTGESASANGLYWRVNYYSPGTAGDLPVGTKVMGTATGESGTLVRTGVTTLDSLSDAAVPATRTIYTDDWTAPAAAEWASVNFLNWTTHGTDYIDIEYVTMQSLADTTLENQATLSVEPAVITLNRDNVQAIKAGQLPIQFQFTRKQGDTDVSSSTTWGRTSPTNYTSAIDSDGELEVTAITSSLEGNIPVTALRDGVTLEGSAKVLFKDDPTDIGGGGVSTDTATVTVDASSTTEVVSHSGTMLVIVGASGDVDCDVTINYSKDNSGSSKWRAEFEYSANGTSGWTDVGVHQDGTFAIGIGIESGEVTVSVSKTGLTTGDPAYFRLMGRLVIDNGDLQPTSGTAVVTSS